MKLHLLLSCLTIFFCAHLTYTCPCSASKQDPRPFFEQHDTPSTQKDEDATREEEEAAEEEEEFDEDESKKIKAEL